MGALALSGGPRAVGRIFFGVYSLSAALWRSHTEYQERRQGNEVSAMRVQVIRRSECGAFHLVRDKWRAITQRLILLLRPLLLIPQGGALPENLGIIPPGPIANAPAIREPTDHLIQARGQLRIFDSNRKAAVLDKGSTAVITKAPLEDWPASVLPIVPLATASMLPSRRAPRSSDSPATAPRYTTWGMEADGGCRRCRPARPDDAPAAVMTYSGLPSAITAPPGVSTRAPATRTPSASARPVSASSQASPVVPGRTPTRTSWVHIPHLLEDFPLDAPLLNLIAVYGPFLSSSSYLLWGLMERPATRIVLPSKHSRAVPGVVCQ